MGYSVHSRFSVPVGFLSVIIPALPVLCSWNWVEVGVSLSFPSPHPVADNQCLLVIINPEVWRNSNSYFLSFIYHHILDLWLSTIIAAVIVLNMLVKYPPAT